MSGIPPRMKLGRVVLALDLSHPPQGHAEAAAALARRFGAELLALYVDDLDLIRSAALPFTRELGLFSAAPRPLDPGPTREAMLRDAERAHRIVEHAALAAAVDWTFRREEGRMTGELIARNLQDALLLVPGVRAAEAARDLGPTPARNTPPRGKDRRPVLVIATGPDFLERSAELAIHLAESDRDIALWLLARGADSAEARAEPPQDRYAVLGARVRRRRTAYTTLPVALRSALSQIDPGTIILPGPLARQLDEELVPLLRTLRCRLVLLP